MRDNSWLGRRNRGLHVTIRDVDCADFDVERFVQDLVDWRVSFFSYFVGGYVTTYPTRLKWQRVSPYLGDRDLAGEINAAAHRAGIKTIGMVDLGQIPEPAAQAHPEWCAWNADGTPVKHATPGIYLACPLGGYQNEYVREILAEMLGRYDLDCMKFGGGSFGFSQSVCYCPACRESLGRPIPPIGEWDDDFKRDYSAWRFEQSRKRALKLAEYVHDVDPTMPVMGNGVAFGDPGWTLRAALDIEFIAEVQDAIQVEVQTRNRYDLATERGNWQSLTWPAETARYMTSVTTKPIWVVASYFLAWPWRRSAMPAAEQKVYLAQAAANGANPMVNLSGGPPAVHEDRRGFSAVRDLYRFLEKHQEYYEGDESAATVAIVYSLETMADYAGSEKQSAYLEEIRGVEKALDETHVPFDILSTRVLEAGDLPERYRVLVLPSLACLSERAAAAIQSFAERGGGLVATFEAGLRDAAGLPRSDSPLLGLLGARAVGEPRRAIEDERLGVQQAYLEIAGSHPIVEGLGDTSVVAWGGPFLPVEPVEASGAAAVAPLTLSAPFVVFPEGLSYPTTPSPANPMLLARDVAGGGRTAYFPGQIGRLHWTVRCPDHGQILANAVRWAARDEVPVEVEAPPTLQVSVRSQEDRLMVHLVNLTGGERMFAQIVPLADVRVAVTGGFSRATVLTSGEELPCSVEDGRAVVTLPRVGDYEVVVFGQ